MKKNSKNLKIIITGGHLSPALAVISMLKQDKKWKIFFIGRKQHFEGDQALSFEWRLIKKLKLPFFPLVTGRLQRNFSIYTLFSIFKIIIGFFQSLRLITKIKPDGILSFGGYIALPVCLAGWLLKVPIVTHEQTFTPGLANRIIALFAKKICLSWPETLPDDAKEKSVLTGNPIRKEVFIKSEISRQRRQISNERLPLIYITGGITGSHIINQAVLETLTELLKKYRVIHQCGESSVYQDYEKLKMKKSKFELKLQNRYYLKKYINLDEIGWVLNSADLVVSRAGANTVSELLSLGKPAILIPLPIAGAGEQTKNAENFKKMKMGIIIDQNDLSGKNLKRKIEWMIKNIDQFNKKGRFLKRKANFEAAQKIVEIIQETFNEKN